MDFILSYVNTELSTFDYDRSFKSMAALRAFVKQEHPRFTSFQIIVVARAARARRRGK